MAIKETTAVNKRRRMAGEDENVNSCRKNSVVTDEYQRVQSVARHVAAAAAAATMGDK